MTVGLFDRTHQISVCRDDELGLRSERAAQVLQDELVRRVGDCHDELAVLEAKGKSRLHARLVHRQGFERCGLGIGTVDLDKRKALLAGQHAAEIALM